MAALTATLWSLALADPAIAGNASSEFRQAVKLSTTKQAFQRAELRLQRARLGMNQTEFFSTMQALVLTRNGRMVAATVDGYLGPDPAEAADRVGDGRSLVFGYRDGRQEVPRILVVFRGERLAEVRHLGSADGCRAESRP
jgi:hypothetical protein